LGAFGFVLASAISAASTWSCYAVLRCCCPIGAANEIEQAFKKKVKMKIFTYNGDSTVTMSPMDSIRYHKFIMQTGLMSMEPQTGYIRAWVGGVNQKYFQYER
jgi:membrane carboxypeptidase/penicillin-binding protein